MRRNTVLVGVVTGAHSIQGEVKVKSFTAEPSSIGVYGPLETEDGRQFVIISTRAARVNEVILRLSGIDTRSAAEALKGQRLFVPRAALPQPAAGEFYHADLIGLRVESPEGQNLGVVSAVLNYGAGDILEIADQNGGTELVPFTDRHVPIVDFNRGRIVVDIPGASEE